MDALEVLAIEAEPLRLEVVEARWVRDRMKANGRNGATLASAEALVAAAEASYEPYRLHVEYATAVRVAADKVRQLAEWRSLPRPDDAVKLLDIETRTRFAESQRDGAAEVVLQLAALIAAHPEASKRAFADVEVSMLAQVGG